MKQAPMLSIGAVNRTSQRVKVTRCKSDRCLYVRLEQDGRGNFSFPIIAIYVDDFILTLNSSNLLELMKQELMVNYNMTDLGDLSWCLGIQVTEGDDAVLLYQSAYVTRLVEILGMHDCKAIKTLTAVNFKKELHVAGNLLNDTEWHIYQSLITSLMWK